jgi:hypothetical protein
MNNDDLHTSIAENMCKLFFYNYDSVIGFSAIWAFRKVNVQYIWKNNLSLKGLFTKIKTKQQVRLKCENWV